MASQTEPSQALRALSLEPSTARDAGPAPEESIDVANGAGAVAEIRSVNGATPATVRIDADLKAPELFLNRELTWLAFNRRVFAEALDESNPLLERVKFLAITASNLDEFFMKRIGGLKQQAVAGMQELTVDGRTPQQQIAECLRRDSRVRGRAARAAARAARAARATPSIHVLAFDQLSPGEQAAMREYYLRNIFPLVTPQAMDPAHPFPFVSNLSLNLLVTLRAPDDAEPSLARVKVPVGLGIPRFLRVEGTRRFVPLEDVIAHNLDLLFPGGQSRRLRVVPRHAQRQHRARRGRGRRSAGADRIRAARPPLRADRAAGSRARHGTRASRDARGGARPRRARRRVRDRRRHAGAARPDGAGGARQSRAARSAAPSGRPCAPARLRATFST